jgi:hypothetical protein
VVPLPRRDPAALRRPARPEGRQIRARPGEVRPTRRRIRRGEAHVPGVAAELSRVQGLLPLYPRSRPVVVGAGLGEGEEPRGGVWNERGPASPFGGLRSSVRRGPIRPDAARVARLPRSPPPLLGARPAVLRGARAAGAPWQIAASGWLADFPAASEFITVFSCSNPWNANRGHFCNRAIDARIRRALDLQERDRGWERVLGCARPPAHRSGPLGLPLHAIPRGPRLEARGQLPAPSFLGGRFLRSSGSGS